MKMKNRISRLMKAAALGMAMAAMAASVSAVSVKAEESLIVEMDQYRTEDGKLFIYANHNKGTDFDVDMQESSVEVAKQSLPIEEVKKFSEVKEPVSYMFMVDISGSMDKSRIDMIRETLHRFIDMKRPADNFCISTMGNEIISTGFSEDTAVLKSFVDEIAVTRQDTDLYTSIKEELNILKTDKSVHLKRCLIIFSDGADDQAGGITRDEAEARGKGKSYSCFHGSFASAGVSGGRY